MVTNLAIYSLMQCTHAEKVEKTGGAFFHVARPSVYNVLGTKIDIICVANVMFYNTTAMMSLTVTREVFES